MAIDRSRTGQELNEKLRLEARLRPKITSLGRRITRRYTQALGTTGQVIDVHEEFGEELEELLAGHYRVVGDAFSSGARGQMPTGAEITEEESDEVEAALVAYFTTRARDQAAIIDETTQEDAVDSFSIARMEQARLDEEREAGEALVSKQEVATIAGAALTRKFARRMGSIALIETQDPAEAAKLTEIEVLLQLDPSVVSRVAAPAAPASKEWATQGDSRVRPIHQVADSITVPVNEPFIVGGERLMYPGDTSLGAGPGNVINCRCSAVHDVGAVASFRMR